MSECDVLLMLGTDFPYRAVLPRGRQHRPGRHPPRAARPPLPARLGARRRRGGDDHRAAAAPPARETDRKHLEKSLDHYRKTRESLDELPALDREGDRLHPPQVAATLSDLAADDAVFTADVGTPTIWAARYCG